jgi:hypothetical protein
MLDQQDNKGVLEITIVFRFFEHLDVWDYPLKMQENRAHV